MPGFRISYIDILPDKLNIRIGVDVGNVLIFDTLDSNTVSLDTKQVMPGAIEGAENVYIISKCKYRMEASLMVWFDTNEIFAKTGMRRTHVITCIDRASKVKICEDMDIQIMIDDNIDICNSCQTKFVRSICLSKTREAGLYSCVDHCKNWTEIEELMSELFDELPILNKITADLEPSKECKKIFEKRDTKLNISITRAMNLRELRFSILEPERSKNIWFSCYYEQTAKYNGDTFGSRLEDKRSQLKYAESISTQKPTEPIPIMTPHDIEHINFDMNDREFLEAFFHLDIYLISDIFSYLTSALVKSCGDLSIKFCSMIETIGAKQDFRLKDSSYSYDCQPFSEKFFAGDFTPYEYQYNQNENFSYSDTESIEDIDSESCDSIITNFNKDINKSVKYLNGDVSQSINRSISNKNLQNSTIFSKKNMNTEFRYREFNRTWMSNTSYELTTEDTSNINDHELIKSTQFEFGNKLSTTIPTSLFKPFNKSFATFAGIENQTQSSLNKQLLCNRNNSRSELNYYSDDTLKSTKNDIESEVKIQNNYNQYEIFYRNTSSKKPPREKDTDIFSWMFQTVKQRPIINGMFYKGSSSSVSEVAQRGGAKKIKIDTEREVLFHRHMDKPIEFRALSIWLAAVDPESARLRVAIIECLEKVSHPAVKLIKRANKLSLRFQYLGLFILNILAECVDQICSLKETAWMTIIHKDIEISSKNRKQKDSTPFGCSAGDSNGSVAQNKSTESSVYYSLLFSIDEDLPKKETSKLLTDGPVKMIIPKQHMAASSEHHLYNNKQKNNQHDTHRDRQNHDTKNNFDWANSKRDYGHSSNYHNHDRHINDDQHHVDNGKVSNKQKYKNNSGNKEKFLLEPSQRDRHQSRTTQNRKQHKDNANERASSKSHINSQGQNSVKSMDNKNTEILDKIGMSNMQSKTKVNKNIYSKENLRKDHANSVKKDNNHEIKRKDNLIEPSNSNKKNRDYTSENQVDNAIISKKYITNSSQDPSTNLVNKTSSTTESKVVNSTESTKMNSKDISKLSSTTVSDTSQQNIRRQSGSKKSIVTKNTVEPRASPSRFTRRPDSTHFQKSKGNLKYVKLLENKGPYQGNTISQHFYATKAVLSKNTITQTDEEYLYKLFALALNLEPEDEFLLRTYDDSLMLYKNFWFINRVIEFLQKPHRLLSLIIDSPRGSHILKTIRPVKIALSHCLCRRNELEEILKVNEVARCVVTPFYGLAPKPTEFEINNAYWGDYTRSFKAHYPEHENISEYLLSSNITKRKGELEFPLIAATSNAILLTPTKNIHIGALFMRYEELCRINVNMMPSATTNSQITLLHISTNVLSGTESFSITDQIDAIRHIVIGLRLHLISSPDFWNAVPLVLFSELCIQSSLLGAVSRFPDLAKVILTRLTLSYSKYKEKFADNFKTILDTDFSNVICKERPYPLEQYSLPRIEVGDPSRLAKKLDEMTQNILYKKTQMNLNHKMTFCDQSSDQGYTKTSQNKLTYANYKPQPKRFDDNIKRYVFDQSKNLNSILSLEQYYACSILEHSTLSFKRSNISVLPYDGTFRKVMNLLWNGFIHQPASCTSYWLRSLPPEAFFNVEIFTALSIPNMITAVSIADVGSFLIPELLTLPYGSDGVCKPRPMHHLYRMPRYMFSQKIFLDNCIYRFQLSVYESYPDVYEPYWMHVWVHHLIYAQSPNALYKLLHIIPPRTLYSLMPVIVVALRKPEFLNEAYELLASNWVEGHFLHAARALTNIPPRLLYLGYFQSLKSFLRLPSEIAQQLQIAKCMRPENLNSVKRARLYFEKIGDSKYSDEVLRLIPQNILYSLSYNPPYPCFEQFFAHHNEYSKQNKIILLNSVTDFEVESYTWDSPHKLHECLDTALNYQKPFFNNVKYYENKSQVQSDREFFFVAKQQTSKYQIAKSLPQELAKVVETTITLPYNKLSDSKIMINAKMEESYYLPYTKWSSDLGAKMSNNHYCYGKLAQEMSTINSKNICPVIDTAFENAKNLLFQA